MDRPWKHAKWGKLDTKGFIKHDSTYTKCLGEVNPKTDRTVSCQGLGEGETGEQLLNEYWVFFWGDENILKIETVAAQDYKCTKCQRIVHFKMFHFMSHEFHQIKNPEGGGTDSAGIYLYPLTPALLSTWGCRRISHYATKRQQTFAQTGWA